MGLFEHLFTRRKRVPIFSKKKESASIPTSEKRANKVCNTEVEHNEPAQTQQENNEFSLLFGEKRARLEREREAEKMMNEIQELLQDTNERIDKVQELVDKVDKSVAHSQTAVEEKVHSEAVKIYRNVQVVLLDLEKKVATQEKMDKEMQTIKNYLKGLTGITAITMLILVFYMLFSLGVF